jgi:peptidylprolyl isomerase
VRYKELGEVMMAQAQVGNEVEVHYKGFLDDGSVFDTSEKKDPLKIKIGDKRVIGDFEDAIVGMSEGEKKTISITPENAYGNYKQELMLKITRDKLPDHINPELGMQLKINREDGDDFVVRITEITDETLTIDGNHPLAGKKLNFDIQLLKVSS